MIKPILNCGSCLFLSREKHFEKPCTELGKIPTSKACGSHKPNVFMLVGDERKIGRLEHLAAAVRGMSATELQTAGALLHAEKSTRKHGWAFLQKVYIRYTGSTSNYMSNFMVGRVLYADKDQVRVVGTSGKVFVTAINDKKSTTIYTHTRFAALRDEMLAAKRFVDPKVKEMAEASKRGAIASVDKVLAQVETISPTLRRGKAREDDLVSLVAKMTQGKLARDRRSNVDRRSSRSKPEGGEIVTAW